MFGKNLRLIVSVVGIASVCLISGLTLAQQNGPQAGAAFTTLSTFETNDFSGSGICAFCHSSLTDKEPKDVSMDAHWRSTMMANAAKDPLWQAKVSSEVARVTEGLDLEQLIQEKCSRCHMGMARYQQLTNGATKYDIYVLDSGFLDPNHSLHEAAMDGVSCTLCHQVTATNLGTEGSYTGQYSIDTDTFSPDRLLFGPYARPPLNPMQQNTGFVPTDHIYGGLQLADSAHCGSCHTLYTPALDADGGYLGEFPEQTTYLEWEHSGVLQTCQDCHLPKATGKVVISNRPRRLAPRDSFGQHHYVGGNSFMVNLLKNNAAVLGVTAEDPHFDATLSRTLAQLEQDTAKVTVTALTITENQLAVEVRVENLAGHKFPSGLPSRRAWLHVTVADAGGKIVFESGKPLADGSIAFNDADANPKDFEPHYDEINFSHEVQIYEPVMLNTDGAVTYTLLRANEYVKDNRLLPTGFIIDNASFPDIGVYGEAEFDDNFTGGSDQILYDVNVSSAKGQDLTVTVELLFQSLSFPFVEDLNVTTTPLPLVQKFMGIYDPAENKPVVVAKILPITVVR